MKNKVFEELKSRGFLYQLTNEEEIKKLLNEKRITFYLGIDPTADSLHIGHFFALRLFRKLQDAGHKGIILIGGATGLVGDPSGKSDLRRIMSKEETKNNAEEITNIVSKFIDFEGSNKAIVVDNGSWMRDYSYIDFIREIGVHFNVNTMLATEAYSNRLKEGGLTFLEMGYMLMQAYDFVYLNKKYNCRLQIGGSDQWANIIAGSNLKRKLSLIDDKDYEEIYGLTCPLLTTKEGKKMGKSEKGTLWVASDKTTVFDFYQYFYNVQDEDVEMLLRLFSDIDLKEIYSLLKKDILKAKRVMAYELTKLVHGEKEANKVLIDIDTLYGDKKGNLNAVPEVSLKLTYLNENKTILDLAFDSKLVDSKSEARRLVLNGGIYLNEEKVLDIHLPINKSSLKEDYLLLQKGKKNFLKINFK